MYSMLLVATPFILLQHFLQQAIGEMSAARMSLGDLTVPIVPSVAVLAVAVLAITFRRQLTGLRIVAGIAVLLLVALAQQIADYYFAHSFYELQQNWHYIAYTLFALMVYRDLAPRGTAMPRIMQVTLLLALLFSNLIDSHTEDVDINYLSWERKVAFWCSLWDTGATGVGHERVYSRFGLCHVMFRCIKNIAHENG